MKRICFFLLFILPLSGAEPVRPAVTIEALVDEALQQNPELNFYRAEIDAARGERRAAAAWANPELSSEIGRKRSSDVGLSAEGTAWSVSVAQTFEFPGRLSLRKAIASRQVELAELGLEQFRRGLAARVRSVAYDLLIAQQKAAAARNIADRGQELITVLVQRDPAGINPLLETRIIEASVLSLKSEALRAITEAQRAQTELNLLRGVLVSDQVAIAPLDLRFPALPSIQELLTIAATNNFQLRMRQVELAQQGFRIDLARNERWPAVSVGPFYSQEQAGEKEQTYGLGLSIPLPLWNRNSGNIHIAEARQSQAETSLRIAQREVERSLREQSVTYNTYVHELSSFRTNILSELQAAAELGDRHYRLGAIPVSIYVELQEKFLEGMDAILDTQATALKSLQEIELTAGIPLGSSSVPRSLPLQLNSETKTP